MIHQYEYKTQSKETKMNLQKIKAILENAGYNPNTQYDRESIQIPTTSPEKLHNATNHDDPIMRILAASHKNVPQDKLQQYLNHQDSNVRNGAVRNPNITPEQLHNVINNEKDQTVLSVAAQSKNANPEHLEKLINHPSPRIREAAASNLNMNENLFSQLLSKPQPDQVKYAAIYNPAIPTHHLEKLSNDPSDGVAEEAKSSLNDR